MSRKITKAQAAKLAKLEHEHEKQFRNIYAAGAPGRNDVGWLDCYGRAPQEAKDAYDAAYTAREDFRNLLIAERRAWSDRGRFTLY